MFETLSLTDVSSVSEITEVGSELSAFESGKNAFNPDARIDVSDCAAKYQPGSKAFDPDRRLEVNSAKKNIADNRNDLTEEQKKEAEKQTGWSDKIIDNIRSPEEIKIYQDAGLNEAKVGGQEALIRNDVDFEQKDSFGRTNRERMEDGLAPLDKNENPIELHHIGQHADSPLAELTVEEHRGKGNYSVLHETSKPSEIDRDIFNLERNLHWQNRIDEEV